MKRFLQQKQTDAHTKAIFFVVISIVTAIVFYLAVMLNDFKQSIFEQSNKQSVLIIDNTGTASTVKLSDTLEEVVTSFSIVYLKKMLTYDYLNYKSNLAYIKSFSTNSAYSFWFKTFERVAGTLDLSKGSYKASIEDFRIIQEEGSFVMHSLVNHKLLSETRAETTKYYVKLTIIVSEPTMSNRIGYFVSDIQFKNTKGMDNEELKEIFKRGN